MKRAEPSASGIRGEYETHGVAGFYKQHGDDYSNPHEGVLAELLRSSLNEWSIQPCRSLDLACGSGEVTVVLEQLGFTEIVGADPYTYEAYRRRTGRNPLKLSFEEIQAGGLEQDRFELIVCSFALHLADESRLPPLLYQLAQMAPTLIVLTPHKRPEILEAWHWRMVDEQMHERVRARLYKRLNKR
ncbi:MAG: hypothetical protein CMO80_01815 [Verrucomicrobiales bacterium]|nr:hypothetical protein [Verrucomicrobiales bacterium]|tara:strand:- start:7045 stop:7605 length:561 start_codon:yes stop_codon:yes gene_type:complete